MHEGIGKPIGMELGKLIDLLSSGTRPIDKVRGQLLSEVLTSDSYRTVIEENSNLGEPYFLRAAEYAFVQEVELYSFVDSFRDEKRDGKLLRQFIDCFSLRLPTVTPPMARKAHELAERVSQKGQKAVAAVLLFRSASNEEHYRIVFPKEFTLIKGRGSYGLELAASVALHFLTEIPMDGEVKIS